MKKNVMIRSTGIAVGPFNLKNIGKPLIEDVAKIHDLCQKNGLPKLVTMDVIKSCISNPKNHCVVTMEDYQIVGFACFCHKADDLVRIEHVVVDKKYQRRGIARNMIRFLIVLTKGVYKKIMVKPHSNYIPAIDLYKSEGFKVIRIEG